MPKSKKALKKNIETQEFDKALQSFNTDKKFQREANSMKDSELFTLDTGGKSNYLNRLVNDTSRINREPLTKDRFIKKNLPKRSKFEIDSIKRLSMKVDINTV